jgi:hypothetical protein
VANELFQSAQQILNDRFRAETKWRRYYAMAHDGLPRRDAKYQWQADIHSKTIDRAIQRATPFWVGQLTGEDRVCNFTALTQQVQEMSDAAADFYDFDTRNNSKLLTKFETAIYFMLLFGRGIIKSTIDPTNDYKVIDEAVNPIFLLMPYSANGFEDADEWIHVRQMTVAAYRQLDQRWDTSPDTIKRIRGTRDFQSIGLYNQEVQLREGVTHTENSNYILIFEHWVKTKSGHDIAYYSPNSPEIPLRKTHQNPYKYGNKESLPFHSFQMEVKDEGWYSPRGLGEKLDVQEQLESFIENKWADAMTIANMRILTGDAPIKNMANLQLEDGMYLPTPGGVSSVQFSPPSMPWSDLLQFERGRSEEISQTPSTSSTAQGSKTGGKPITAEEAKNIAALAQVGINHGADIVRRDVIKIHRHRWAMICQFNERDWSFFATTEMRTLPQQAIHDKYLITPDGSPDAWNRGLRIQKEITLMNTFAQLPNADPDYWVERAMRAVDGQAAREGFKGMGGKAADEYQAQANEIVLLTTQPQFEIKPQASQDHATRIRCDVDYLHNSQKMGIMLPPQIVQRIQMNIAQRLDMLKKQNPAAAKEIQAALTAMDPTSGQAQPPMNPPEGSPPQPPTGP